MRRFNKKWNNTIQGKNKNKKIYKRKKNLKKHKIFKKLSRPTSK